MLFAVSIMASIEEKVAEFISVTGVDEERAQFYLQSSNGELHVALETFYDNDDGAGMQSYSESQEQQQFEKLETHDEIHEGAAKWIHSAIVPGRDGAEETSSSRHQAKSKKGRFATISSFNNEGKSGDGQTFYAGGSETSGQQILGPDRKKKNPTQELFDAAKRHGAEILDEASTSKSELKPMVFKGAGYKLGSDVEASQEVNPNLNTNDFPSEPKDVAIKFWKNGFSVDNGPLRDFNDPNNREFLDAIGRGEVPTELRRSAQKGEVHVNMEDHREEDYVKPKETLKAFSGTGRVLGSPVPTVVQERSTSCLSHQPQNPTFEVDNTRPVTTIQIRFSDGTRLVSKFNHDNTVGDIRNLVQRARPNTGSFNLMTTFPNKILDDNSKTITEAKLLNAVIVQRMT